MTMIGVAQKLTGKLLFPIESTELTRKFAIITV